jgi:hypothetical protein
VALTESGDYDAAIYRLSKVIDDLAEHDFVIPSYFWARGWAYQGKGMTDMAKLDFKKALPKMIQALRNARLAQSFNLADDPLICADGMLDGCHKGPSDEQSRVLMINRLRILSGQNFGYDPGATAEENEAAIVGWEQWLESGGAINVTPDVEPLELTPAGAPQP